MRAAPPPCDPCSMRSTAARLFCMLCLFIQNGLVAASWLSSPRHTSPDTQQACASAQDLYDSSLASSFAGRHRSRTGPVERRLGSVASGAAEQSAQRRRRAPCGSDDAQLDELGGEVVEQLHVARVVPEGSNAAIGAWKHPAAATPPKRRPRPASRLSWIPCFVLQMFGSFIFMAFSSHQ